MNKTFSKCYNYAVFIKKCGKRNYRFVFHYLNQSVMGTFTVLLVWFLKVLEFYNIYYFWYIISVIIIIIVINQTYIW